MTVSVASAFDRLADQQLAAGGQVCVFHGGRIVDSEVSGMASANRPMTTNTVVPWLCAGKPVAALVVLRALALAGRSPEMELTSVVPELVERVSANVTVRDCLTHRAGLASDGDAPRSLGSNAWCPYLGGDKSIVQGPIIRGRGVPYDVDVGYALAALAAERVDGRSFSDIAAEEVFAPASMTRSFFGSSLPPADRLECLFSRRSGKMEGSLLSEEQFSVTRPGFGLFSTAENLAKFYSVFFDGDGSPYPELVDDMLVPTGYDVDVSQPVLLHYGTGVIFGSTLSPSCGEQAVGHDGSELTLAFRDGDISCAVFINGFLANPLFEAARMRKVLAALGLASPR